MAKKKRVPIVRFSHSSKGRGKKLRHTRGACLSENTGGKKGTFVEKGGIKPT